VRTLRGRSAVALALLAALGWVAGIPTATAATAARPAAGRVKLRIAGAYEVSGRLVTVVGRPFTLAGVVRPYAPGQSVTLRVIQRGHTVATHSLAVTAIDGGAAGRFSRRVHLPAAGVAQLQITHRAGSATTALRAAREIDVLAPSARLGSRGPLVALIQRRLLAAHIYLVRSGIYDSSTAWAIDAYHRLLGWGTYDTVDRRTVDALLDGTGAFHARFPGQGRHAEADLTHRLLALVDGAHVRWILPISPGKPSTPTVLGSFRIYYRVPGYLPDGMYYSSFFHTGYAIHGYDPAPNYAASHGCLRLPIQDAIFVYDWLAMGDWVDTYYR
jgi:lipoprotein-anchoring transpeptidase ErfK/SrfK